ncbi:unnamed protein product [Onchocerca flexuosa]|uniref:Ovule protein n=1 Tax=Onchocerca flexuosa TaxID=387005 RepID=A0A183HEM2_9BILA|nr:unnamed protein product [Onchocerca flexuosa]
MCWGKIHQSLQNFFQFFERNCNTMNTWNAMTSSDRSFEGQTMMEQVCTQEELIGRNASQEQTSIIYYVHAYANTLTYS